MKNCYCKLFFSWLVIFAITAQNFCQAAESKRLKKYRHKFEVYDPKARSSEITEKDFIKVKAGKFIMCKRDGENDRDETEHEVTLTQDYWIGIYEVTQVQYQAIMGKNPSKHKGGALPVENVSWNDVMEFCVKLNEKTEGLRPKGFVYTLPTEAQWEFAAIGGTKSRGFKYSGDNVLDNVAWHRGSAKGKDRKSHPVGQKKPNELGLYDMSGNVDEWCLDKYQMNLGKEPLTDPTGSETGDVRVRRGGNFRSESKVCRSRYRNQVGDTGTSASTTGFRLVLVPEKKPDTQEQVQEQPQGQQQEQKSVENHQKKSKKNKKRRK